jgi:hypothetical protein
MSMVDAPKPTTLNCFLSIAEYPCRMLVFVQSLLIVYLSDDEQKAKTLLEL